MQRPWGSLEHSSLEALKADRGLESSTDGMWHFRRLWGARERLAAGQPGWDPPNCLSQLCPVSLPQLPCPPAQASPPACGPSRGEGEALAGHPQPLPFPGPGKGGCFCSHPPEGLEGYEPGGGKLWERAQSPGALAWSSWLLEPDRDFAPTQSSPWGRAGAGSCHLPPKAPLLAGSGKAGQETEGTGQVQVQAP